jgi:metal-dependent amidase/aminoacylase/carboxypeptidase family protein
VVSRGLDPLDAAVLSVTRFFAGGEAYNVIPGEARIGGTVRAFRPEVEDAIEAAMERICAAWPPPTASRPPWTTGAAIRPP